MGKRNRTSRRAGSRVLTALSTVVIVVGGEFVTVSSPFAPAVFGAREAAAATSGDTNIRYRRLSDHHDGERLGVRIPGKPSADYFWIHPGNVDA